MTSYSGRRLSGGVLALMVLVGALIALADRPAAGAGVVGGFVLAALFVRRPRAVRTDDLRRHLSAARRRGERAELVVFTLPAPSHGDQPELPDFFRLTDSVTVQRRGSELEIALALDHPGLDRAGVQRRITTATGIATAFGWATFPDDGVTVDALLETARARAAEAAPALPWHPQPVASHRTASAPVRTGSNGDAAAAARLGR